jgi:hypothetical protein
MLLSAGSLAEEKRSCERLQSKALLLAPAKMHDSPALLLIASEAKFLQHAVVRFRRPE